MLMENILTLTVLIGSSCYGLWFEYYNMPIEIARIKYARNKNLRQKCSLVIGRRLRVGKPFFPFILNLIGS